MIAIRLSTQKSEQPRTDLSSFHELLRDDKTAVLDDGPSDGHCRGEDGQDKDRCEEVVFDLLVTHRPFSAAKALFSIELAQHEWRAIPHSIHIE